jgi:hypothetical protein
MILVRVCLTEAIQNYDPSGAWVGEFHAAERWRHWLVPGDDVEEMMLDAMESIDCSDAWIEGEYGAVFAERVAEQGRSQYGAWERSVRFAYRFWKYDLDEADEYPGEIADEELPWIP